MVGFHGLGRDGQRGDNPGDDANDEDGEQFLLDAIGRFAVKMLDLETNFFAPIMVFDRPAPITRVDNALAREGVLVEQIGRQDRHRAIRMRQADNAQLDGLERFAFLPGESALGRVAGHEPYPTLRQAAMHEGFDRRKR